METFLNWLADFYLYIKGLNTFWRYVGHIATPGWWQLLLCFLTCCFLMTNRLSAVEKNGFEGTLIGTLVMPYFSGFPNLCFAYLLLKSPAGGALVVENCIVNNLTNLTLVLALPCIFWGLNLFKSRNSEVPALKIDHLSLLLSILALIFFSVSTLFVSKDGKIDAFDGMLLVTIFLFWQLFHIFDVLKNNTRKERTIKKRILLDLLIIGLCAWGIYSSIDNLLVWVTTHPEAKIFKPHLGLLSGLLMVIPNAFLAVYYAAVKRSEIAYSSQIGDCHICIPLCIGLFAVFSPITAGPSLETALLIIIGASAGHFFFTAFFGRLPRFAGACLACLYAFFFYKGIL